MQHIPSSLAYARPVPHAPGLLPAGSAPIHAVHESMGLAHLVSRIRRAEAAQPGSRYPGLVATPHILLIDPDIDRLDYLERILSGQGFGVTRSTVALDIDCIQQLAPDVSVITLDPGQVGAALDIPPTDLSISALWNIPIVHFARRDGHAVSPLANLLAALQAPNTPDALLRVIDTAMTGRTAVESRPDGC